MNRRDFMKFSGVMAGVVLIPVHQLHAEEMVMVSPDEPQAKALGYVAQSVTEGKHCSNCAQAKGDLTGAAVGCNIFPGKQVKATGYCNVWSPRPA